MPNTRNSGRNTTSITNPRTKSMNTNSNTGARNTRGVSSRSMQSNMSKVNASSKSKSDWSNWNQNNNHNNNWNEEISSDVLLNDADIISDILSNQKSLIKMYGTAICEIDCEDLRNILNTQLSECADDQFDAFLYMNERGLYPTDQAPMPKVRQAIKHFSSIEQTFK